MKVALIISTYNWEPALDLVLQSVPKQSRLPDEVIIADDGSDEITATLIERHRQDFPVPLIHAWQEDRGFRAARSRNNAVKQSSGDCLDYLIFVDGDTILHRHFIADHLYFAARNHFTVGSRVLIDEVATQNFLQSGQFDFSLSKTSATNKLNALRFLPFARHYGKSVREPIEKWIFKVRSCNMGVWRSDYEAINGFNHDFSGWGREDSEFALRLFKKGLSMRRLKFAAVQYHLYHHESDRSYLESNDEQLKVTLKATGFHCENGMEQLTRTK